MASQSVSVGVTGRVSETWTIHKNPSQL